MKKYVGKPLVMLLAFCVAFSGLPFLAGDLDAHAASKKAAKKITLRASASGQTTAVLNWNKIRKPQKGYAVFRDGKAIAHLGKKLAYTDSGLSAGSVYTYQIRVYKTKKVKKWYNTKTGNWQKKKPAKKYRGASKKFVTYKYQKPSNVVRICTAAAAPASTNTAGTSTSGGSQTLSVPVAPTGVKVTVVNGKSFKITWDAVPGATSYRVHRYIGTSKASTNPVARTYVNDASVSAGITYYYTVTAINDAGVSKESTRVKAVISTAEVTKETKTVTSFDGSTTQIYKNSNEDCWRYVSNDVAVSSMAAIDKTVDGEFTLGSEKYVQYHGATFNVTEIQNYSKKPRKDYPINMYNGTASKFAIESDATIEAVNTYYSESGAAGTPITPMTRYYYNKNGKRVAGANMDGSMYKTSNSGNITTYTVTVSTWGNVGSGIGIYTDIINYTIKYDGKTITTLAIDTGKDYMDPGTPQNGITGRRKIYLDIAQAAVEAYGGPKNLESDLHHIESYVKAHYTYGEKVSRYNTYINMTCAGGAGVLETWSIWKYGEWGFTGPGSSSFDTHLAFRLNSAPRSGYYETQGSGDPNAYFEDENGNFNSGYELEP